MLITSLEPYICFLNQEGLARFCTENYEKPNSKNFSNYYMHLTNYSLNKESPKFILNKEDFLGINDATKRTLTSVKKNLEQMGHDVAGIMQRIEDLIMSFLTSMHPFLLYNFKNAFQKDVSKAKCSHILGFDVLLDSELKPWLLEINANPSLNIEHEYMGKDGKFVTEHSPLDEYVKGLVMEDAIRLIMKTPEK